MPLTTHNDSNTKKLHPDVRDNPHYVIANPTCYTREEVAQARYNAFHSQGERNATKH